MNAMRNCRRYFSNIYKDSNINDSMNIVENLPWLLNVLEKGLT